MINKFMPNSVKFDCEGVCPPIKPLTEDKKQLLGSCGGSAAHKEAEHAFQLESSQGKEARVSVGERSGLLPHNID
jgi:hypothetical protein